MVTIRVFGQTLLPCVDDPEMQCDIAGPLSVRALLESQSETLGGILTFLHKGELMVTVNQKVSTLDSQVNDGDVVTLTHQFNPEYEGAMWHNP